MTKRIYNSNDYAYNVILDSRQLEKMLNFCKEKMPFETGGIIVGNYTEDGNYARITDISGPPKDSKHSKRNFYRGIADLTTWLSELWDKGEYYLGEWHFHPNSYPIPSIIDINQMKKISLDLRYHCPEPILLIVGGNPNYRWDISCHIFLKGKLIITMN